MKLFKKLLSLFARSNKEDIELVKRILNDYRTASLYGDVYSVGVRQHRGMHRGICRYVMDLDVHQDFTLNVFKWIQAKRESDHPMFEMSYYGYFCTKGHITKRLPYIELLLQDLINDKSFKII